MRNMKMDISQSRLQVEFTAGGNYSAKDIKGFWAKTVGTIVYDDQAGVEHTITGMPAFLVPPIAGDIALKSGTTVDLLIFL